ncbi:hypothetical protein [Terriglobus sp.]|uniref:hypothetical protein n=1 Tax=Terriglobus sp. TaxID=1889013 RepID=UPI003AFFE30B
MQPPGRNEDLVLGRSGAPDRCGLRATPAAGKTATGRHVGKEQIPSDALGKCNDGTFVSTGKKDTACAAHGGMQIWYLDSTPNN